MRTSFAVSPPSAGTFRTALVASLSLVAAAANAQLPGQIPFVDTAALIKQTTAEKPKFAERQQRLLQHRYDLSDRPSKETTMSLGKPIQEGVRVKLPEGITWDQLAGMTPEEIKEKTLWPAGFYPLPHPHHENGGMVFPKVQIDELEKQTGRDLTRFDPA